MVDALRPFDHVVEVGIGTRTAVAAELAAAGKRVTATDVVEREVPDCVRFVVDAVTDPDPGVYRGADAVYALNLPPELHRPARRVARQVDADFLFTTLGGDEPAVPADPEQIPYDVLYRAQD
ncbi:hypothetical protein BRC81_17015 [Halobacteriales archaeon QS_1_68_20]|nr:MAG: hypothetical protein BRC81_17015 [Halobacteriales archaeon QS_1_68_20]